MRSILTSSKYGQFGDWKPKRWDRLVNSSPMLLLLFSSNMTPRIFFATNILPSTRLRRVVPSKPRACNEYRLCRTEVPPPAGGRLKPAGRGSHGQEDRPRRARHVPGIRGL